MKNKELRRARSKVFKILKIVFGSILLTLSIVVTSPIWLVVGFGYWLFGNESFKDSMLAIIEDVVKSVFEFLEIPIILGSVDNGRKED